MKRCHDETGYQINKIREKAVELQSMKGAILGFDLTFKSLRPSDAYMRQ